MRIRRGEALRPGRMVSYANAVVGALAVTSLVMLVKYRNLSTQMSDETMVHQLSKKALQDELMNEADRKKKLDADLNLKSLEIKNLSVKVKTSEDQLANSVKAVMASNDQLEMLKREKEAQLEHSKQLKQERDDFQTQLETSQDEVASIKDQLKKTNALVDDSNGSLKDAQDKQDKLLSENQKLTKEISDLQSLQGENDNLRNQLQEAIAQAKDAKAKMTELEAKVAPQAQAAPQAAPQAQAAAPQAPAATEKGQVVNEGKDDQKVPVTKAKDDLEDYDMLDDAAKANVKKAIQGDNDTDVKAVEAESNHTENAGGEGAEGDVIDDNEDEEPVKNAEDNELVGGGESAVAGPRAFEELEEDGSFAVNSGRNLLSWKAIDSSDNEA